MKAAPRPLKPFIIIIMGSVAAMKLAMAACCCCLSIPAARFEGNEDEEGAVGPLMPPAAADAAIEPMAAPAITEIGIGPAAAEMLPPVEAMDGGAMMTGPESGNKSAIHSSVKICQ